jgi:hypothetical protein
MYLGRFNSDHDNYTCISHKGTTVVDYVITLQDCFLKCINFKVTTSSHAVQMCNSQKLINSKCKPPDHSILSFSLQTMNLVLYETDNQSGNEICNN